MRNKNTMSKRSFIVDSLYWSFIAMALYKNLLFKNIGEYNLSKSKTILWVLFIVLVAIGTFMTYEKRRNNLSVLVNIAVPLSIYFIISYWTYITGWIIAMFLVAIGLSSAYMYIMFRGNRDEKKNIKTKKRIHTALLGSRTIISFCSLLLMSPFVISVMLGNSLFYADTSPEKSTRENEWTIANNIDVVLNLQEDSWDKLSTSEKVDTMQTIANIESNYLGLPHELNVVIRPLGESVIASYDDRTHAININIGYLDEHSSYEVLDSICHEAYHAYQHRLCEAFDSVDDTYKELMAFDYAAEFKIEFADNDGSDDYFAYRTQYCESTARSYAREAVKDYRNKIEEHLKRNTEVIKEAKGE